MTLHPPETRPLSRSLLPSILRVFLPLPAPLAPSHQSGNGDFLGDR
ncbi:hypothetical protein RSOL_217410 [Rhizoctonia solani AG-3 Rhs1AP]|uniref:Uncharacterized protein n=1 Tax=Rhizoctonia solani AG-3 Rhs1AP TaxID=1086054 RepID=X8J4P3_9AGAM|nr:hypothetical protein RSOL_217410 [Rhizoctonia solani AG-3 Rhs1AP]